MEILSSAAQKSYRRVLVLTKKTYIVNLVGEDHWCEDKDNESSTADLLEGDDGLLNDLSDENLMDEEIFTKTKIFECWRNYSHSRIWRPDSRSTLKVSHLQRPEHDFAMTKYNGHRTIPIKDLDVL